MSPVLQLHREQQRQRAILVLPMHVAADNACGACEGCSAGLMFQRNTTLCQEQHRRAAYLLLPVHLAGDDALGLGSCVVCPLAWHDAHYNLYNGTTVALRKLHVCRDCHPHSTPSSHTQQLQSSSSSSGLLSWTSPNLAAFY
jgi:hypothetical protein